MFERRLAPVEILSESSLIALERGWQRLVSEIGIQFQHEGVLERFRAAGQRVEDDVVRFDPEWVLEQVRKAPSSFDAAGHAARSLRFAPERMAFCACQSAPFVREAGVRRNATVDDFRNFVRLTQVIDELDTPGYPICEPADLDVETRHLDLQLLLATETDKPYAAAQFDPVGCSDSIAMSAIVHGGLDVLRESPALFGVINANSPLRFDGRMLDSLLVLAEARQVRRRHAVHPDGRDGPGLGRRLARPADRRGAHGDRARPARVARLPGRDGLVRLALEHAVGLARLRRPRVGDRAARLGTDRAPLRPALALRRAAG